MNEVGTVVMPKANLVAQGFNQVEGVDYSIIPRNVCTDPVDLPLSGCLLTATACENGLEVLHLEVNQAPVYAIKPRGFTCHSPPQGVVVDKGVRCC